jgi:S1-C subfamily serine protease
MMSFLIMAYTRLFLPIFQKVLCEEDKKSVCKIVMPSIFLLKSQSSSTYCGGFFINNQGYGISAYHFYSDLGNKLDDCVLVYNGAAYEVDLIDKSEENHLIVVKADSLDSTPFLNFSTKEVKLGSEVTLFSVNPFGVTIFEPGYFLDYNYTMVSQVKFPCFRASCRGGPGYSGGPLVNGSGEVIGMHKSYSGMFEIFDTISIPSKYILKYLDENGVYTQDGWII